jgi:hypothetical protein
MRAGFLILICVLFAPLQGCLAWRYRTTPSVKGRVLDSASHSPVDAATVGFRNHKGVLARTTADGRFHLEAGHTWGAAIIIPFEFTHCGGVLFVEAAGYDPFERDFGPWAYDPIVLDQPIMLSKMQKPNKAPEPTPGAVTSRAD